MLDVIAGALMLAATEAALVPGFDMTAPAQARYAARVCADRTADWRESCLEGQRQGWRRAIEAMGYANDLQKSAFAEALREVQTGDYVDVLAAFSVYRVRTGAVPPAPPTGRKSVRQHCEDLMDSIGQSSSAVLLEACMEQEAAARDRVGW